MPEAKPSTRECADSFCQDTFEDNGRYNHYLCPRCRVLPQHQKTMEQHRKTRDYMLARWPHLVAHLICESLGYFTPMSAVNAIIAYQEKISWSCEWYWDIASRRFRIENKSPFIIDNERRWEELLLDTNKQIIQSAIKTRHSHKGYMADYTQALAIVRRAIQGNHPMLASWF